MFVTVSTKTFSTNLSRINALRNSFKIRKQHKNIFPSTARRYPESIAFVKGSQAPPACPSDKRKLNMEHSWNDTDKDNRKTEVLLGKPVQMPVYTTGNLDLRFLQG
jgi:hypothetical protein